MRWLLPLVLGGALAGWFVWIRAAVVDQEWDVRAQVELYRTRRRRELAQSKRRMSGRGEHIRGRLAQDLRRAQAPGRRAT